ncbi:protein WVD2-like 4 [Capsicum annuum]
MKLEEKVHAKEEETRQLQARKQEKKEAEIKQLWRNLNFKVTPMPSFYREPDHRSEKTKVSLGSKANVLNQHKSTEEQPIARKVVASRASCTKKVSHRLYQSVNRRV